MNLPTTDIATHERTWTARPYHSLTWFATEKMETAQGVHGFICDCPTLPLRPGGYASKVSPWDDSGKVDAREGVPDLLVDTPSYQQARDEWGGLLSIPIVVKVNACLEPRLPNPLAPTEETGDDRPSARVTGPKDV